MPKMRCVSTCDGSACARPELRKVRLTGLVARSQDGSTPLHLAAAAGHLDTVRLLLDKSDVDAEDKNGNTPVWAAFASSRSEVARFLLEEGEADVDASCEDGMTYLHQAAQRKSTDDAVWLLAHKASAKAKDKFADTPLHAAAAAGAWRVGRLLVDAGADVNARGKVRRSQQLPLDLRVGPHRSCARRTRALRCTSLRSTPQTRVIGRASSSSCSQRVQTLVR